MVLGVSIEAQTWKDGKEKGGGFIELSFSWVGTTLLKRILAPAHSYQGRSSDCALVSLCDSGLAPQTFDISQDGPKSRCPS